MFNFHGSSGCLKICTLMDCFCPKHTKFWWKSKEELCLMTLTLCSKNDSRSFVNFNARIGKSETLHFDVLLLSIAYKISAEKIHQSYLSWHWRVIQTLKKNWLSVWKMTRGIWWILTRVVESLKICTFMDYFCRKYLILKIKKYRGVLSWKMTYGLKMT